MQKPSFSYLHSTLPRRHLDQYPVIISHEMGTGAWNSGPERCPVSPFPSPLTACPVPCSQAPELSSLGGVAGDRRLWARPRRPSLGGTLGGCRFPAGQPLETTSEGWARAPRPTPDGRREAARSRAQGQDQDRSGSRLACLGFYVIPSGAQGWNPGPPSQSKRPACCGRVLLPLRPGHEKAFARTFQNGSAGWALPVARSDLAKAACCGCGATPGLSCRGAPCHPRCRLTSLTTAGPGRRTPRCQGAAPELPPGPLLRVEAWPGPWTSGKAPGWGWLARPWSEAECACTGGSEEEEEQPERGWGGLVVEWRVGRGWEKAWPVEAKAESSPTQRMI